MEVLFLDDNKARTSTFKCEYIWATCVETVEETLEQLQKQAWDFAFLDHDLNDEVYCDSDRTDCGMEVVRWIEKNKPTIQKVVCHSLNEKTRDEMVDRLTKAGYDVKGIPFIYFDEAGIYKALIELREQYGRN